MHWSTILRSALNIHLNSVNRLQQESDRRMIAPDLGAMLKQELAFIKALSACEISPACYKHLIETLGRKRPTSTGKRKVAELASASDGSEPTTRRLATGTGPASELQCEGTSSERAASGGRHIGSPKGGISYAAAEATPSATYIPSGPIKPTAKSSDLSEPAVSSETAQGRMSNGMSGPLN
jgi:hypothetical protein